MDQQNAESSLLGRGQSSTELPGRAGEGVGPKRLGNGGAVPIDFDGLFEAAEKPMVLTGIPFEFPRSVMPTRLGQICCATGKVDDHGRISDRSAARALKWASGQHLCYESDGLSILVRPTGDSRWAIGRAGYLKLPAEYRNVCNLVTGDQVVMIAMPDHEQLVVLPVAVVAAALWSYRPKMWGVAA